MSPIKRLAAQHVLALAAAVQRARLSQIATAASPESPQAKQEALRDLKAIEKKLGDAENVSPIQALVSAVLQITKSFEKLGNEYASTLQYFLGGDFQVLVDVAGVLRDAYNKNRDDEPSMKASIQKALQGLAPIIEKLGGKPAVKPGQPAKGPAQPQTRHQEQEFDFGDE